MADDTTFIMKDIQSITNAINIFKDFEMCSGLKLNLNKYIANAMVSPRGKNSVVSSKDSWED